MNSDYTISKREEVYSTPTPRKTCYFGLVPGLVLGASLVMPSIGAYPQPSTTVSLTGTAPSRRCELRPKEESVTLGVTDDAVNLQTTLLRAQRDLFRRDYSEQKIQVEDDASSSVAGLEYESEERYLSVEYPVKTKKMRIKKVRRPAEYTIRINELDSYYSEL